MLTRDLSSVLLQTEIRAMEIDGENMLKGRKKMAQVILKYGR